MKKGEIYLLPTVLGKNTINSTIPEIVKTYINLINVFIVENIRTSRRYIKLIVKDKNIENIQFYSYGKNDTLNLNTSILPHILNGEDIGVLSEAGLPCIADPGATIVSYAHKKRITVIPIVGPSSIFLALMGSGMNGQNFMFNGYLPIDKIKRKKKIKDLENTVRKENTTQIFMETPYRNHILLNAILNTCNKKTKLCIAVNISSKNQYIKTKSILEWQREKINIHKKPAIFLIGL